MKEDKVMTEEELVGLLQEKVFTPAAALRGVPMTPEQTGDLLRLMSAGPASEAVWQNGLDAALREFHIIQNIARRFQRTPSAGVKTFLALICQSPADVVLYLSFAHLQVRDRRIPSLDLSVLCDLFSMDFWAEADRLTLWNAQKLPASACRAFGSDNGLDTEAFQGWINDGEPDDDGKPDDDGAEDDWDEHDGFILCDCGHWSDENNRFCEQCYHQI